MTLDFKYNADGLIPAIVQETGTNRVLMMAWMNAAALEKTSDTGFMNYWSRSRQKSLAEGGDERAHPAPGALVCGLRPGYAAL